MCALLILSLLCAKPVWSQGDSTKDSSSSSAESQKSAPWHFSLRPYIFLSGLTGSVTAGKITIPINSGFRKLLDNLRVGGFLSFTADKGQWGLYADIEYISLVGAGSGSLDAKLQLDNVIAEADVTYRPGNAPTLKFLAGVRSYSIDQTLIVREEAEYSTNTTVVDPILGAQGAWTMGNRWDFEMRGDIGGFGISSEFTYQLLLVFNWDISHTLSIPFGYRLLGYQIKSGDVWMNTRMSGMVFGLDIRF